mmetsp:Transcript_47163/g.145466  ORF Transcript_47163/g.145466 Transcript_47163/m.145466 type:complete len:246 (-) Transcript_47163:2890-3627(-)
MAAPGRARLSFVASAWPSPSRSSSSSSSSSSQCHTKLSATSRFCAAATSRKSAVSITLRNTMACGAHHSAVACETAMAASATMATVAAYPAAWKPSASTVTCSSFDPRAAVAAASTWVEPSVSDADVLPSPSLETPPRAGGGAATASMSSQYIASVALGDATAKATWLRTVTVAGFTPMRSPRLTPKSPRSAGSYGRRAPNATSRRSSTMRYMEKGSASSGCTMAPAAVAQAAKAKTALVALSSG